MWRITCNKELKELYKDLDIVADVKNKRLEWIGHVERMDEVGTVKEIFECKTGGSRRIGRPRLRWLEDVEKVLLEMQVKRWRQAAVDNKKRSP